MRRKAIHVMLVLWLAMFCASTAALAQNGGQNRLADALKELNEEVKAVSARL
ncbi:hypothetical protein [Desulfosarcina alkanivorans]|uniref:hypothetical protein n=1 Tax=Desulfosarcina alkanivorans TaxID=571177 RepID=UPI0012D2ABB2|nr:hypothetical protein [Desulfosarcina alkanivorans]